MRRAGFTVVRLAAETRVVPENYRGAMTEKISPATFHAAEGVDDWRVVFEGACAHFRTRTFVAGLALVNEIGRLAETAQHHPDIDLRYGAVTVRLSTHEVRGLSQRDVSLAQQISAAARDLGVTADPSAVQTVQVAVDAVVSTDLLPFWRAVLGYEQFGDEDLLDPRRRGPAIWFQQMEEPRTGRNRIHVDISVPHDQAEARVAAGVAAGGRVVSDRYAPAWWTLADPEGNEVDIATWMGRE
jgi:4a-hydroxytetrahydrobiopterin dehydratase